MKILSDLLAVILFFLTYTVTKDMIAATAVALVVGVLQAAFTYWKFKKLDTMQGRIGFNRGIRRGDHPAERSSIHHVETVRIVLDRRTDPAFQPPCREKRT